MTQEEREEKKLKRKTYIKEYRKLNAEQIKISKDLWRKNNKDKVKIHGDNYRKKNKDNIRERKRVYCENKRKSDELFRLKENIRVLIKSSFLNKNHKKKSKTVDILGLTIENFKQHLESKFEPWMTWVNYGRYNGTPNYGWDIDHIIPLKTRVIEERK